MHPATTAGRPLPTVRLHNVVGRWYQPNERQTKRTKNKR